MMKNTKVNEQVTITAIGFRKNLITYPRRMEFHGVTYNFIDAGIRCLVRCGGCMAEIITLSDGIADYYLRTDNQGNDWTLLSITS